MNQFDQEFLIIKNKIQDKLQVIGSIQSEMSKIIIGQNELVKNLLIALLSDGHILLEGMPGLAKTLAINTLSKIIDVSFKRIQFTPDLLPADILGTMIYNQKQEDFIVKKGPIFSNFILADEINRSPAKVQSALLECMQERQVTLGDNTYILPNPFMVMATQNPIEQEGTYSLPEAQIDRFMLKVVLDYPLQNEEIEVMKKNVSLDGFEKINPIIKSDEIIELRNIVKDIYIADSMYQYIVEIVNSTRNNKGNFMNFENIINYGASPRASISMAMASKALAFLNGRHFVIPEDVREVSLNVLRHRIGLSYEAEAENITAVEIINSILNKVDIP